jgi:lipopolysaccharide transport system ATP-binding protein
MSDTVIHVENLGKKYIIGHQKNDRYTTLRDSIANGVKSLGRQFLKPLGQPTSSSTREEFWALRDVSFEVKQGDRVGIIGRNGAGKSTLLKILSRITEPTKGRITIQGRVASLLEVGTGFHPELTGRENIFLNGAVLGMGKAEIKRKFDEIVAFAEVEKFLDTPVKRYSSGMYVRLAFAVAAHLEPEILVVDEVLAVGDLQFQKKCLGKMGQVAKEGRTVLFVSHNMAAINTLCSRAILLDKGNIICQGNIDECIAAYESRHLTARDKNWVRPPTLPRSHLAIEKVSSNLKGEQPYLIVELEVFLKSYLSHKPAFVAIEILDSNGVILMQAIPELEGFLKYIYQEHEIDISIQLPPLIPGQYLVNLWIGSHNTETLDEVKEIVMFEVSESPTRGRTFPHTIEHGYIVPISKVRSRAIIPMIEIE